MKKTVNIMFVFVFLFCTISLHAQVEQKIKSEVQKVTSELVEVREHLHQHPELSNKEFETAKYLAGKLKELGIEFEENVGGTGIVAVIKGKPGSRVAAVRADMDALPLTESTGLPFASVNDGVMHACGHDVHMTVGLGTAMVLNQLRDTFEGTVKFLFQPAEEAGGGARKMVAQGALKDPDADVIFGLHVGIGSGIHTGNIGYVSGGTLASSDGFSITIKGKGTHASTPWDGIDPIVTAAQVINSLQNVRSRMTDTRKAVVVTIGTIEGGTASNIIPEEVRMRGTIRTHDQVVREQIPVLMEQIIKNVCEANGADYSFRHSFGLGVTYNEPGLTEWSAGILKSVLGQEHVQKALPVLGAEDFSVYANAIPGFFYFLGVTDESKLYSTYTVHNPNFAADGNAVPVGVEAMVNLVINYLNSDVTFTLNR
ncbi:M20 family metallopeptidase [candidate division KSB1 bacterium]